MLAYSYQPPFALRLPTGNSNTSLVNIIVQVRDILNCVTEYTLRPVIVRSDAAEVTTLIDALQQTSVQTINNNPTIQLLASGNPNVVGQVLTSVSQVFNQINNENIDNAISSEMIEQIAVRSTASSFFRRCSRGQYFDFAVGRNESSDGQSSRSTRFDFKRSSSF